MQKKGKKLNLGCGLNAVLDSTWINCDNSIFAYLRKVPFIWKLSCAVINFSNLPSSYTRYPKVKLVNLNKKFPWKSNTVGFIYCSHVIEHLFRYELKNMLKEAHRVLENGGRIRILVPDLEKISALYKTANREQLKSWSDNYVNSKADFVNHFFYPAGNLSEKKPSFSSTVMNLFVRHHKYIYDFRTLEKVLKHVGFQKIQQVGPEHTDFPDAHFLDSKQEISLHIEAEKSE